MTVSVLGTRESAAGGPPGAPPLTGIRRDPVPRSQGTPSPTPATHAATGDVSRFRWTA